MVRAIKKDPQGKWVDAEFYPAGMKKNVWTHRMDLNLRLPDQILGRTKRTIGNKLESWHTSFYVVQGDGEPTMNCVIVL